MSLIKKKIVLLIVALFFCGGIAAAQTLPHRRAGRMGLGMNLTYLDNYWLGTPQKRFADFMKMSDVLKRRRSFADIAAAGFRTVRVPVCFSAWASLEAPYRWETDEGLKALDLFVEWALENNLNVIIDNHHPEFNGTVTGAATTERMAAVWKGVAERYKNTDPEKVFFELRNEPHDMPAAEWRAQAKELIKAVRAVAPRHTLVVGFHDWNSRAALVESEPFEDANIIYTFHYYDPFVFTHQGATWSGEGVAELKDIPFPWSKANKINIPAAARGKWVENLIKSYERDSRAEKMFADLAAAKSWSVKKNVPIFLGEFGSYNLRPAPADRCRHAEVVYAALGRLEIPNAWWEWDAGFSMFEKGTTRIMDCMRKAVDSYHANKPGK